MLHVLAHVTATAPLAASLHDARYVAQVAAQLGPADQRPLGDDARWLGALLRDHAALASVQLLAWLFDDVAQAQASSASALAELSPRAVARPELLAGLQRSEAAELLLCAALLEAPCWQQLPPLPPQDSLHERILALAPLAPRLHTVGLASLRALGQRGRVALEEIWVGAPGWGAATEEGCAWQAAHEASVLEVCERCAEVAGEHDAREELAVALLARRAERAGEGAAQARWLAAFEPPRSVLGPALGPLLDRLDTG